MNLEEVKKLVLKKTEEMIKEIQDALREETHRVLQEMQEITPEFLEKLSVDLLAIIVITMAIERISVRLRDKLSDVWNQELPLLSK